MDFSRRIGVIAGNGKFPLLFAKAARQKHYQIYAVAIKNEAPADLGSYVDAIEWLHVGQIKRLIKFFKQHDVKEAAMVGGVKKTKMFSDIKPDAKAIAFLARMTHTHDDGLLGAFARLLEKEGIKIQASTFLLPELLAPEGCWTKRKPNKSERKDMAFGLNMAREVGRLDIGQCVVVSGGSVLAVEAVDGTDETIKRGGRLGRGEAVVIKICKPNQDFRFDVPAIGVRTIETMHASGANLLVIEAGKAVVFDRDEMIDLANTWGIAIVAV